ncbi:MULTISPECIES: VanZ family protein [Microbacterium]|uniref:VanZ family protein n=1 Tax=Microbacterium TaxID=33882 RepID=UPI00146C4804|nr:MULTISPECIES: VanZ family protein [Microbacterium]
MTPARDRRPVLAALGVYAALVLILLIAPVSYADAVHAIDDVLRDGFGLTWFGSGWIEFAANVVVFVPLGLLLAILMDRPLRGVVVCIAISVVVELAQFLVPPRQASVRDVVANALGAVIGAGIAWSVARRRGRGTGKG